MVFASLHSTRASRLRKRRPSRLPAGAVQPEPVPITRVTVIGAESFDDEAQAAEWLGRCRGKGEHVSEEIATALAHVNRAIVAYRVCATDPYAGYVSRDRAVRVRMGYGNGDDLVDGAWKDAYAIPEEHGRSRRSRRRMLTPEEELAGILSGRRPPARPSEELLLRARADFDNDRPIEAALQTRAAVDALASELTAEGESRLPAAHAATAARLAQEALSGGVGDEGRAQLAELLVTLERVVRRRRYRETD